MNLDTKTLATRIEEWAAEVTSFNSEAHQPTILSEALPLVICEIKGDNRANRSVQLPKISGYEQAFVRTRTAELLLMSHPEPSWTASQALYDAVDLLADDLIRRPQLGVPARVHIASPLYDASYDPPEIQHQDGTVARVARFRMYVGELIKEV